MGKVMSVAVAKAQRFNAENRAQRIIAQAKPKPAPTYEANLKDLEKVLKENPDIVEEMNKKDAGLDDRLKKVFVNTSGYLDQRRIINPDRPLPMSRSVVEDYEFGFQEPEKVTVGKCTLRQAVQFISDHQAHPSDWTVDKISAEFKLKRDNAQDVLEHFHMFQVQIPKHGENKKLLSKLLGKKEENFSDALAEARYINKNKPPVEP